MTEPIARIEAALERLGAEHEPPADWEARVLAQIGRAPWWRRLIRWRIAIPIAAAAAAAVVIAFLTTPTQRELGLALAYQDTGVVVRGGGTSRRRARGASRSRTARSSASIAGRTAGDRDMLE